MPEYVRSKNIWLAEGQRSLVLLVPGAGGNIYKAVLGLPHLRWKTSGQPILSAVFVLKRQPLPLEENLGPLIVSGTLTFDLTLFVPDLVLERAAAGEDAPVQRLYADEVNFTLLHGMDSPSILARARASGIALRAGMSVPLNHEQCMDVIAALDGHLTSLRLHAEIRSQGSTPSRITFECGLEEIIGGALDGLEQDAYLHFVCPGGNGSGPVTTPRRTRSTPGDRGFRAKGAMALTTTHGAAQSLSLALQPATSTVRPTTALLASDLVLSHSVSPAIGKISQNWWLSDLVLAGDENRLRALPVVDNPKDAIWRDRANANTYWYAPEFELLFPSPSADPAASPFLFCFERIGVTASGAPALTAEVRFTLRKKQSQATVEALQRLGRPAVRQVPLSNLSSSFWVPYTDERTAELRWNALPAQVSESGDLITLTVKLINDAVRLAYGALSLPGFQRQPPRLQLAYQLLAYVPVEKNKLEVASGGKIAYTALAFNRAGDAVLSTSAGEVAFTKAPPARPFLASFAGSAVTSIAAAPATSVATVSPVANASLIAYTPQVAAHTAIIARPNITASEGIAQLLLRTQYATQTLIREERIDSVFPCNPLGAFYEEQRASGSMAIGCVDALRLGQTTLQLYAEMPELAKPAFRVFRSLQQPGRFLVLPTAYRITRYGPSEGDKAYRPAILVHSYVDISNPTETRVIYHATLQPDITPAERRELRQRLTAEAAIPVVEYPTELIADTSYTWTLGSSLRVDIQVVKTPDSLQASFSTDMGGAVLLQQVIQTTGFTGNAVFRLSDGTPLSVLLSVNLTGITGPWTSGPIEMAINGTAVTMTNRIDQPVEISGLRTYQPAGTAQEVRVEMSLAPGASSTQAIPSSASEVYALYQVPAGAVTVEEVRSFVEDIQTNVVFIDLINYDNHNLARVEVQARIKDVPGTKRVDMPGSPPRGSADFLLPLTTFLRNRILQFQVTKVLRTSAQQTTPWLEWNLEANGNVVSLTWELIQ